MPSFSASAGDQPARAAELRRRLESDDPREAIVLKLEVRDRLITVIEARLAASPDDTHQRFLLEEHLKAREDLIEELRLLRRDQDPRYQQLDALVDDYVQDLEAGRGTEVIPAAALETLEVLEHEQKTWEEMVTKVRARLVKRPGDPQLMRLLAEHQARLLKVQEAVFALKAPAAPPPAEFLPAASSVVPATAPPSGESALEPAQAEAAVPLDPRRQALERERETFATMIEKTRQRLAAKPELGHLKGLIAQHEQRITEIDSQLAALGE